MEAVNQRVIAYVDGYNVYYGFLRKGWRKYLWLDYRSAAHCVSMRSGNTRWQTKVDALIGTVDLLGNPSTLERITIEEVHLHPQWSGSVTGGEDIALLKLSSPTVAPSVQLANVAVDAYQPATLIGWGMIDPDVPESSQLLQHVEVQMVDTANCLAYEYWEIAGTLCFVAPNGVGQHQGGCKGDSGGPALIGSSGAFQQIGVTSFIDVDITPPLEDPICSRFTAYTRIGAVSHWIKCTSGVTVANSGVKNLLCQVTAGGSTGWID